MALEIGKNDRFERIYMAAFRAMASEFGEFAEYERDRAGRDIGLHFVSERADGGEIVTPALVWFQMKGIQSKTFSADDFNSATDLPISLEVAHLRFWYIAPEPTYLALYIEAVNSFFVLNIQKYVSENFGDEILTLKQKTLTVRVSKDSVLDQQAFHLIKQRRSVSAWQSRIEDGENFANVFFRDADLIRRLATADERRVTVKFVLRKYGSKMRSEAYFYELDNDDEADPVMIREHWQYMMPDELDRVFPYLDFEPDTEIDGDEDSLWEDEDDPWGNDSGWPPLILPNGKSVLPNGVFEMVEYSIVVTLNDSGKAWSQTLEVMESAGFIELNDKGNSMVSVAPWHWRDV